MKTPQTQMAEKKIRELMDAIFYDTNSLTHALVKAHRSGMASQSGFEGFGLLRDAILKAEECYRIAITMPENKTGARPEVNL